MLVSSLSELVGSTPLLDISQLAKAHGSRDGLCLYAKLEYFNPSSSVKDRAAYYIIKEAAASGALPAGGTVVEATSGNTGIGLASLAAAMGYKMVVVMPETMSVERRQLMAYLGAELILSPGDQGMKGAVSLAEQIAAERGAFLASQFTNQQNAQAHFETTGPELYEDLSGELDVLVTGVGTGGTLSGAGAFLKSKLPDLKVIAVEPEESSVLSGENPGKHGIQGIGAGFIPEILKTELIDRIERVSTQDALASAREFAASTGALVGISSGAALCAAYRLAQEEVFAGKRIAVVLPDTAERYLSTPLFSA